MLASQAILLPEQHTLTVKLSIFMVVLDRPWTGRVWIPGLFPQISKRRHRPLTASLLHAASSLLGEDWHSVEGASGA